jgi:NAD(P)-dependent dehydrogenase (short-subunit alcohol dehydrogenase family)
MHHQADCTLLLPCVHCRPAQTAKDVVASVAKELGRLDILVNNASEQHVQKELTDISPEQLQRTFTTNVFGYFYFAQVRMH